MTIKEQRTTDSVVKMKTIMESITEAEAEEEMSRTAAKKKAKADGAEKIHNQDGVLVVLLKTFEASKLYGAGSTWGTASRRKVFDSFSEKGGPLCIIIHGDEKYQFSNKDRLFLNANSRPVTFDSIDPAIAESLSKSNHSEIQQALKNFSG